MEEKTNWLVFGISALLGVGQLLPWNCFINSWGYWMWKFADDEEAYKGQAGLENDTYRIDDTFYQTFWTSFLGVCVMLVIVLMLFVNMVIADRVARDVRVYVSLWTMFFMFLLTTIMSKVDTSSWTAAFFWLTLLTVVINQSGGGIFQGATFGICGLLREPYFNAMIQGQALAGILTSVLAIVPTLIFKEDIENLEGKTVQVVNQYDAALMYFCIATGVVLLTIVAYWTLLRTDLGKERLVVQQETLLPGDESAKKPVTFAQVFSDVARISKICKYQALALILDFWITLAVFPAIQQQGVSQCTDSSIETSEWYCNNIATSELFPLIFCFLFFNVFDWAGRWLSGVWQIFGLESQKSLNIFTLSRIVWAGLFFFTRRSNYAGLSFLGYDASYAIISAIFATTNGYVSGLSFMYGPMMVKSDKDRELCGSLMPVFLGVGLLLGAATSFLTVLAIK